MNRLIAVTVLVAAPASAIAQETPAEPSVADFGFLVGEWEGRSTFHYPNEEGREQSHESVTATCQYILKDTYIQCDSAWARADGRVRTLRWHINYNAIDGGYQKLFIYDNYPRHVSYLLHYEQALGAYVGLSEFEEADGTTGDERVEIRVSEAGDEMNVTEAYHSATDPDEFWATSFTYVWRKVK